MQERDLNFVTNDRNQILEILSRSKQEGNAVGILSNRLGPGLLVTAVDEIVIEDLKIIIVLKHFDHTGYILPSYKLDLEEIISVCPFNSKFKNPYLDNIGKEKSWFF